MRIGLLARRDCRGGAKPAKVKQVSSGACHAFKSAIVMQQTSLQSPRCQHAAAVQRTASSRRAPRLPLLVVGALPSDRRSSSSGSSLRSSSSGDSKSAALAVGAAVQAPLGSRPRLINGSGHGGSSSRRRLKVAVDVDEVLGRFLHSLNTFCLEAYNERWEVSDYWIYDFAKIWKCSQDESNHKVHEFFASDHFAEGIEVIPGSYESLERLRHQCDLMVVTSRQHVIQEPTLEWIDRHFPEIFSEVHFGNHFALEGVSKKKSDICRSIGAEVLIDDNPSYALECAQAGIRVLLYDWELAYPWSKTEDGPTHDLITRVRDWQEVEEVLGVLAATKR